jgi:hypothetical protein
MHISCTVLCVLRTCTGGVGRWGSTVTLLTWYRPGLPELLHKAGGCRRPRLVPPSLHWLLLLLLLLLVGVCAAACCCPSLPSSIACPADGRLGAAAMELQGAAGQLLLRAGLGQVKLVAPLPGNAGLHGTAAGAGEGGGLAAAGPAVGVAMVSCRHMWMHSAP